MCIPNTSLCNVLIWELHDGGLAGDLDRDKTTTLIADCFLFGPTYARIWPKLCLTVELASLQKATKQNIGLYTPLPVPHIP